MRPSSREGFKLLVVARAIWRGAISFGLVTIPVRLYPAVRRHDVRFREIDRRTGRRVRHQRVREPDLMFHGQPAMRPASAEAPAAPVPTRVDEPVREEVSRTDLVRGFEIEPGRYVQVSDEELDELAPERSRTIDIEQFVSRKELDPIFFDTAYYVVPDQDRARPFALLLRALQETNRAAICWFVLRSKRHLAAVQPRGDLMLLTTLLFADEIVPADAVVPRLPDDLSPRETEMAELLVNTLAGPFEPDRYRDEYRERVLALIESRTGEGVVEPGPPPAVTGVEDLMAALHKSIEQARAQRAPSRRRREAQSS
jgi:DNA end-binding protein Ku